MFSFYIINYVSSYFYTIYYFVFIFFYMPARKSLPLPAACQTASGMVC